MSFNFKKPEGGEMPTFLPGQYISVRIPKGQIAGTDHDIVRNYSMSAGPNADFYRISIKKEVAQDSINPDGLVSSYFHDHIKVGQKVEVSTTTT